MPGRGKNKPAWQRAIERVRDTPASLSDHTLTRREITDSIVLGTVVAALRDHRRNRIIGNERAQADSPDLPTE